MTAPKPIRRAQVPEGQESVPRSKLGQIADEQKELIESSDYLSKVVPRMQKLDRLTTVREMIPRVIQELNRARARQMTAEQNVDRAIAALVNMFDAPVEDQYKDKPDEFRELTEKHDSLMADRPGQAELAEGLVEQIERFTKTAQGIAKEISGFVVEDQKYPGLTDKLTKLGEERIELEQFAQDEMDAPLPEFSTDGEVDSQLETLEKNAWDAAQEDPNVIKIDAEEEGEEEDVSMDDLIRSMPTEAS